MTDTPSTPPEGTPGVPPTGPATPPPAGMGTPGGFAASGGIMDAPAAYAGPPATPDDKTMAMLAHFLGIITGFVGPLIIWLIKKDRSPFVNDQGKEALNFEITVLIAWIVAAIIARLTCVGLILFPAVAAGNLIFCLMAGLKAKDGIAYRYPFAIRFVK